MILQFGAAMGPKRLQKPETFCKNKFQLKYGSGHNKATCIHGDVNQARHEIRPRCLSKTRVQTWSRYMGRRARSTWQTSTSCRPMIGKSVFTSNSFCCYQHPCRYSIVSNIMFKVPIKYLWRWRWSCVQIAAAVGTMKAPRQRIQVSGAP